MRAPLLFTLTAVLSIPASAGVVLTEGFNTVSNLTAAGWTTINNSTPGGTSAWSQGNSLAAFDAQSGASNSYIAASFTNAAFGGNISNWLILPLLTLQNGDTLSFWTRTETNPFPGDNLQVRLSSNGSSSNVGSTTTSVGDFSLLLTSVGTSVYPTSWTQFTSTVSGLASPTAARLAFRYVVTDTSVSGDYIGIDTVTVTSAVTGVVPEPTTSSLLLVSGILVLAIAQVRMQRAASL